MRLDRINLRLDSRNRCDWSAARRQSHEVIDWYFAEVTKMKADIGVSEVEKQAAGAGEDA
jgi:hypothetical protein